jgi:hypothetical protein
MLSYARLLANAWGEYQREPTERLHLPGMYFDGPGSRQRRGGSVCRSQLVARHQGAANQARWERGKVHGHTLSLSRVEDHDRCIPGRAERVMLQVRQRFAPLAEIGGGGGAGSRIQLFFT